MIKQIKNIGYGLLNFFPHKVRIGSSTRQTNLLVLGIVAVCLVLCISMTFSIQRKLAFFIDSFELPATSALTVGEGSDVCFDHVPHDYLIITPESDGSFSWQVNPEYRDTLMYFKINDENPQKHSILDDEEQTVTVCFRGEQPDTITLTGHEVWEAWDDFEEQQDVLLRHFVARPALCNDLSVRSFFERSKKDDAIYLIILDDNTTLRDAEGEVAYVRSGRTSHEGEEQNRCKVQFFSVSDHCYMDGDTDNGTFQVDSVNYVMKASVLLTAWGAGHAMIEQQDDGRLAVHFPKAVGYVGTLDSLYKSSGNTSHIVTFKQQGKSFPTGTDIYLPQISGAMNQDICNVEMKGKKDVWVLDVNNNRERVKSARTGFFPFALVPSLRTMTLHSGKATMRCRVGFVGTGFALSYLTLPLIVALVLLFITLGKWSPVRMNKNAAFWNDNFYSVAQLKNYPQFFAILIVIAFTYCVCKSLIALKLSYTYPYFEKMTGITPVATSLFLLVFFTLAMVFNYHLIHAQEPTLEDEESYMPRNKSGRRKWYAWSAVLMLFVGLIFAMFVLLDSVVSGEVIKSYFHSQIYSLNVMRWREIFGINDTHRSIPYTLIFVEGALLVVWFLQNLYCSKASVRSMFDGWKKTCTDVLMKRYGLLGQKVQTFWAKRKDMFFERFRPVTENEKFKLVSHHILRLVNYNREHFLISIFVLVLLVGLAYFFDAVAPYVLFVAFIWAVLSLRDSMVLAVRLLFPWHFVLLLSLVVFGPMMGNFGTAFITIAVIFGLCKALTDVKFAVEESDLPYDEQKSPHDTRHTSFLQMLIISIIYIICAMKADNGYMTNYMGFLMAVLCFYFVMDRNTENGDGDKERTKGEATWVYTITLLAIVLFSFLPSICGRLIHTDDVNYSRISRRIMLYSNFDDLQKSGFRYAETDAEFMIIMSHYMQETEGGDPLSNENHFLHSSISSGQSPVVLNDLSVPAAFIGAYGVVRSTTVFFLLLLALLILVAQYSFGSKSDEDDGYSYLTCAMQWRLLALFMWLGTSVYIYLSYLGQIPFAGRLLPGFGVDAVGEALESAILLAFMATVTTKRKALSTHNS